MNLLRLIILGTTIWIAWFLFKRWQAEKNSRKVLDKPPKKTELMQQCEYCGVHLPASEAVHHNNKVYCCTAHQKAAQQ